MPQLSDFRYAGLLCSLNAMQNGGILAMMILWIHGKELFMAIPKIMFAGGGERGQYLTHKGNDTTIRFVLKYPGRVTIA